jgi:rhodanese-related sulfurtransferase
MVRPLDRLLADARAGLTRLDPQETWAAIQDGAVLVDIRPEYLRRTDGEIPGAIVIERNHLEWRLHPESEDRIPEAVDADVRWILFCDEGYASSIAAAALQTLGLRHATDLVGGFQAWRHARLPVVVPETPTVPRMSSRV